MRKKKIFVISAPSGTGKSTVVRLLLERYSEQYQIELVISYTSRLARSGELFARDYYFITKEEFLNKVKQNFFLEYTLYNNNYYGIAYETFSHDNGRHKIVIVTRSGAQELKKKDKNCVLIWLMPPSEKALKERLAKRGSESIDEQEKRFLLAQKELLEERDHPLYDYHIENNNLDETVKKIALIIEKELVSEK